MATRGSHRDPRGPRVRHVDEPLLPHLHRFSHRAATAGASLKPLLAPPAASDDDDDARWKRRGGATTARAALRSSISAPRRGGMAAASPRAVR